LDKVSNRNSISTDNVQAATQPDNNEANSPTKKIKEIIVLFILMCDLLVSTDSFTRLNKNNLPPHARASHV
jgi:hypothetical protein